MEPSELYPQIEDGQLVELCFETIREQLPSLVTSEIRDFQVFAISDGVFLCRSEVQSDSRPTKSGRTVVLRLDKLNPLKSTLITQPKSVEVIAAYEFHQNGLGPRLLSVFKNGRVEEWIEGRPVGNRLRKDKEMQKLVAQCIARINAIDSVPAERSDNFLTEKVGVFLRLIYKSKSVSNYRRLSNIVNSNLSVDTTADPNNESNTKPNVEPNVESCADSSQNDNEMNPDKIIGLESELNFLKEGLSKLACSRQLVFSHNDLSQENIFQRLDSSIYVLSYDLAAYNFRGYDLAHFLNNLAFDLDEPPTDPNQLNWISDADLSEFLAHYLSKLTELKGEQTADLIKEVKFFRLFSSYLSILVSFLAILTSEPSESNLVFLKLRIGIYFKLKADLVSHYAEFLDR